MALASVYVDAKTSVFWDVEDFPIPFGDSYHETIRSALEKNGYVGEVSILAYGDKKPDNNLDDGITFIRKSDKHVRLNRMLFDIRVWANQRFFKSPYYNLLLIAKNITQTTQIERVLREACVGREINVLVVLPDDVQEAEAPPAHSVWSSWKSLIDGEKPIDPQPPRYGKLEPSRIVDKDIYSYVPRWEITPCFR
ncbi:uncharacterized protein LOC112087795 [Eutrema salsugineum]|uniref:uncharacterized protein LOC112087795 n=1 Tax=Eutrema salsugineum TaxID=72664 RepID=UPI000CED23FA|nr:uncharacterized protein LOC112087795 [Eutrema salsugineum]